MGLLAHLLGIRYNHSVWLVECNGNLLVCSRAFLNSFGLDGFGLPIYLVGELSLKWIPLDFVGLMGPGFRMFCSQFAEERLPWYVYWEGFYVPQ